MPYPGAVPPLVYRNRVWKRIPKQLVQDGQVVEDALEVGQVVNHRNVEVRLRVARHPAQLVQLQHGRMLSRSKAFE